MNNKDIKDIMLRLNDIISNCGYRNFEIAILILLRADENTIDNLKSDDLEGLDNLIEYNDSLLDINKEDIDDILYKYVVGEVD